MNDEQAWLERIQQWAKELGFSQIGISGVDLSSSEPRLLEWLARGFHGQMHYMQTHGLKRARPAELVPGTVSVITARMDYLPRDTTAGWVDAELERQQRPQEDSYPSTINTPNCMGGLPQLYRHRLELRRGS